MCQRKADLVRALMEFSADEMRQIYKAAHDAVSASAMFSFVPGDKVEFNGRHGQVLQGVVEKLNRKRVSVTVDGFHRGWLVPATMLRKV